MTIVEDHEGELYRALERLGRRTPYAEFLAENRVGEMVNLDSKSVTTTPTPYLRGVVYRVWTGRQWAEAAVSGFEPSGLDATASALEREAARAGGRAPPPGESTTSHGAWAALARRPLRELGSEGMISLAREIRGWAMGVPGIAETSASLGWEETERLFSNTAGARCHQRIERTRAHVLPIAMESGRVGAVRFQRGVVGGLELLPALTEPIVRHAAEETCELLRAKAPPTGEIDVLLDPGVAGTFAHESFGHGTEADQFLRDRSYLKPILGEVVGPEFLTIVDDGTFPGGWGSTFCDDEGNRTQRTLLIDRGRFVGALHDRETAAAFHTQATGNTRRSDFASRAFVRMTNTYVAPADRTKEELVSDVQDGVLMEHWNSGIEDPLGGQMQIKVTRGRRIEHGRLTDVVGGMALSGKVLDFLRSIRGVGRQDRVEMEAGSCGKGHSDILPVGSGGVYVLSRAIVGPA